MAARTREAAARRRAQAGRGRPVPCSRTAAHNAARDSNSSTTSSSTGRSARTLSSGSLRSPPNIVHRSVRTLILCASRGTKRFQASRTGPCLHSETHIYVLQEHVQQSYRQRRFICGLCEARFSKQGDLSRHLAFHDQTPPPNKCVASSSCAETIARTCALARSLTHAHTHLHTRARAGAFFRMNDQSMSQLFCVGTFGTTIQRER